MAFVFAEPGHDVGGPVHVAVDAFSVDIGQSLPHTPLVDRAGGDVEPGGDASVQQARAHRERVRGSASRAGAVRGLNYRRLRGRCAGARIRARIRARQG